MTGRPKINAKSVKSSILLARENKQKEDAARVAASKAAKQSPPKVAPDLARKRMPDLSLLSPPTPEEEMSWSSPEKTTPDKPSVSRKLNLTPSPLNFCRFILPPLIPNVFRYWFRLFTMAPTGT